MSEITEERREPGQIVNLSEKEHNRQFIYNVVGMLLVAGIVALNYVWADTRQNSRDIQRHEISITEIQNDMRQVVQDVAVIRKILEGK